MLTKKRKKKHLFTYADPIYDIYIYGFIIHDVMAQNSVHDVVVLNS